MFKNALNMITILIGILSLLGWIFHIPPLVAPPFQHALAIRYSVSIAFIALGAGFIYFQINQILLARILAFMVIFISVVGVIENFLDINFNLDYFFHPSFMTPFEQFNLPRIGLTNAVFLTFLGITLYLLTNPLSLAKWFPLPILFTMLILIITSLELFNQLYYHSPIYVLGSFSPIGIYTNIGLFTASAALLISIYLENREKNLKSSFPLMAGVSLLGILLSWAFCRVILEQEFDYIRDTVSHKNVQIGRTIATELKTRATNLLNLSDLWAKGSFDPNDPLTKYGASLFLKDYPSTEAIGLLDENAKINWVKLTDLPIDFGTFHNTIEEYLAEINFTHVDTVDLYISRSFSINQKAKLALLIIPLKNSNHHRYLLLALDIKKLLSEILPPDILNQQYNFEIREGDQKVYHNMDRYKEYEGGFGAKGLFNMYGLNWELKTWLVPHLGQNIPVPFILKAMFPAGILTALITIFIIHLWQQVKRRSQALAQEIEERERIENALRINEDRTRELLNSAFQPDLTEKDRQLIESISGGVEAVITTDKDLIVSSINPLGEKLFATEEKQIVGKPIQQLLSSSSIAQFIAFIERYKKNPQELSNLRTLEARRSNGTVFPIDLAISQSVENGHEVYLFLVRDISSQKELIHLIIDSRDGLNKAKIAAEEVAKSKTDFLANMSHEIRTPMNSIVGMTDLLLETPLTDEQKEYATICKNSSEHLLNLINDILDLSAFETGKIVFNNVDFSLLDLMEKTIQFLTHTAKNKGLKLEMWYDPQAPISIRGDPQRLRQVLFNLLSNAIKFTDAGEIYLKVEKNENVLTFSVSDTGRGIPKEQFHLLFQRFSQLVPNGAIATGTGLGLNICKIIVELMGGRIWVESEEGAGSTFYFTVPIKAVEEKEIAPAPVVKAAPREILRQAKILVAEDSQENYTLIKFFLKNQEYGLDHAENGKIALEKMKANDYDIVLMDMQMPVMDGYEATKQYREWEKENNRKPIPMVALTAYALKEDEEKCLNAGCTDYLSKPVNKDKLIHKIEEDLSLS